jgi:tetratricopeptide (TPR) repeat protein
MVVIMDRRDEELYALALEADRHLLGPDQREWLDRLDREQESLLALLERLVSSEDSERALRLSGALARFWWMRGHTAVGRQQMERVLALAGRSEDARAAALVGAGSLDYAAGEFRAARRHLEEAIALLRNLERPAELAQALDQAGMTARQLMELEDAQALHAEALEIARRVGAPSGTQALCLNNLGVVAFFRGELDAARAYHQQALALRKQAGDLRGQASSWNNLGQVARFAGDLTLALSCMEHGLVLRRELGDRWGVAGSQVNLATVQALLGNVADARAHLESAETGFRAVGDPLGECECLEAAAELAHAEGRRTDAVRFYSDAAQRRERLPAPRSPLLERTVAEDLARLREHLGEEVFQTAWGS